jgi:hypothetical protein
MINRKKTSGGAGRGAAWLKIAEKVSITNYASTIMQVDLHAAEYSSSHRAFRNAW